MYILSNKMNNSYHTPNLPNNTPSFYGNFSSFVPHFDIISSHQPCLQPRAVEPYNQKQMKQLVEQIRFKEKMEIINKKKGKYKRSTNNCHKKYIGILKNLLFLKLQNGPKEYMAANYFQYRNSRVYYFIILSYIKWYLPVAEIRWIYQHFCKEVQGKMTRYKLEISTTNNSNFIHFRRDEIIEMDYSIQAINLFLMGDEEESIRLLYQKNKYIIIKKNQYLKSLQIVRQLRSELQRKFKTLDLEKKVSQLKLHEVYQWKKEDTDKYITSANLFEEKQKGLDSKSEQMNFNKRFEMNEEDERQEESYVQNNNEQKFNNFQFQPVLNFKTEAIKVKQEEPVNDEIKKYPLIGLENSYPIIDFLTWHTWQMHKQKRFEFQMKLRETMNYNYNQNIFVYLPATKNN